MPRFQKSDIFPFHQFNSRYRVRPYFTVLEVYRVTLKWNKVRSQ